MPAFCDSCGTMFPSGFAFDNSVNVTLSGNTAGPCPTCGGTGHIPDGVFNFVGDTVEILSAPSRTVDELTRLAAIIRNARVHDLGPETVVEQIETETPALAGLAAVLPHTRAEFYAFLALILTVITLLTQSKPAATPSITVEQVITQTYIQAAPAAAASSSQQPSRVVPKVGRNALCPCGSGMKYKRCCGR